MKLLVVGASSGIGAALAEQAVREGHGVTALVRRPERMRPGAVGVRIVKGDIRDKDKVSAAVAGQDAVCITIGINPSFRPVTVFSEGTRAVVEAMKRHSVRKLICVTGIGAGDSRGHGGFLYDRIVFPILLKRIYEDKDVQESIVRNSSLEWVIVRPGFLTNGPVTCRYSVLTDLTGVTCGSISRGDVAHFILRELESMKHAGQTLLLTS
ncbi:MAG: SDR family oxidoreductase [Thermodesulfobacteriota bacterium]